MRSVWHFLRQHLIHQRRGVRSFDQALEQAGGLASRVDRGIKEVPVEKTIAQIGRSLNQVAEFGAGYGIEIRVEVHGRGTAEIATFKKIMDAADNTNVRVCWNCNGSDLDGGLEHNFDLLKARFGSTLHMHDLRTKTYPWDQLFVLLKKAKYEGWTLLEEGAIPPDIVAAIKENRKIWDKLTAEK